jgi:hypothetical protein
MLSICVIGSQARGTADSLSDRDVLIVGVSGAERDARAREWSTDGWNVSAFDTPAFRRLAQVGSLFVQHVKQDGRIVRDDGGRLRQTLARYSPKTEYIGERNDALRQIATLPGQDGRYWHDLCLADIIYVLIRNAAILHLGSRGQYCFSYDELILRLADDLQLDEEVMRVLRCLRHLKHAYRSREARAEVQGLVDGARKATALIAKRVGGLDTSAIAAGVTSDTYIKRRLCELELAASLGPKVLDALPADHPLGKVWQDMMRSAGYPKKESFGLH